MSFNLHPVRWSAMPALAERPVGREPVEQQEQQILNSKNSK
jgi:hypothetical protein